MKIRVCKGEKTKELLARIRPGDFVLVKHRNMDEAICQDLIRAGIKGVLNTELIATEEYPNKGPLLMSKAGIILLENISEQVFTDVKDGLYLTIKGNKIFHRGHFLDQGQLLTEKEICRRLETSQQEIKKKLSQFLDNTLIRARLEKDIIFAVEVPKLKVAMLNKSVLVVVRGRDYFEDLRAILPFIKEEKPVVMAVDGGADGCLKLGLRPDIIIGDMDSVSTMALRKGKEIIVHAYPDGRAPGAARIEALGLPYTKFRALGTSEDVAMILAHECGADMIVAVGTHSNLIDFLDKGRPGMASTLLVRLKLGTTLIDAKGVGKLYQRKVKPKEMAYLILTALFPIFSALYLSPTFRPFLNMAILRLRLFLRF